MISELQRVVGRDTSSRPTIWRQDGFVLSAHVGLSPARTVELFVLAVPEQTDPDPNALLAEPAVLEEGIQVGFWHRAPSALRRPLRCLWAYASGLSGRSIEVATSRSTLRLDPVRTSELTSAMHTTAGSIVTGADTSFVRLSTDIVPSEPDAPLPIQVESPDADLIGLWHFGGREGRALSVAAFEGEHDQLRLSIRGT